MHNRLLASFVSIVTVATFVPTAAFAATSQSASVIKKVHVQSVIKDTNAQLEGKARKGDVEAAYQLGMRYYLGDASTKTKKDDKKAVVWLSLAILEGKSVANQYELETYFSKHLTDVQRAALTNQLDGIMAGIPTLRGRSDISLDATQDAQRKKDINAIADALIKYYTEHKRNFPARLTKKMIGICRVSGPDCKNLVNISDLIGQNIAALPIDPTAKVDSKSTGYLLSADKGVLTIYAPNANEKGVKVIRRY